jgi:hypothetical protein
MTIHGNGRLLQASSNPLNFEQALLQHLQHQNN